MSDNIQPRIQHNSIQCMRGIAIIVVLIHHAISQTTNRGTVLFDIDRILISFHMPTFFIIAGYLFEMGQMKEKRCFRVFVTKKAKRLLVPYAFWTVLLWIGVLIGNIISADFMESIGFPSMSFNLLLVNLLTYEVYLVEMLWFPYVLFVFFICHYWIGVIGRTKWFLFLGLILGLTTKMINYPNLITRMLVWGCFFALGRMLVADEKVTKAADSYKSVVVITFIVSAFIYIVMNHIDTGMDQNLWGIILQLCKYMVGLLGVWSVFVLSKTAGKWKLLKSIGDYSYDIYLMHNPYVVAPVAILCSRLLKLPGVCSVIIATVTGIIVPIVISRLIIRRSKQLSVLMIGT